MADSIIEGSSGGGPPAEDESWRQRYWRKNLRLVIVLLAIWFLVGYVFSILLVEQFNTVEIGGFPVGLWFAQQGSILTFVVLILVYALVMDRIDDEFGVSERDGNGERQ